MKALVKVEKNGITISKEALGVNEGQILEIQTEKVYVSQKDKKLFSNKIITLQ